MFSHMVRGAVRSVTRHLLDEWRDPYGCEAHPLDVIKLADQALPCATAVDSPGRITRCGGRQVRSSKSVGHDLVNTLFPPSCGREGCGRRNEGSCHEEGEQRLEDHGVILGRRGLQRREGHNLCISTTLGNSAAFEILSLGGHGHFISQNRRERSWAEMRSTVVPLD